jgi:hypothetical protein
VLAPSEFVPNWKEGLPEEDYHGDPLTVSSTGLRAMLKSPKKFKHDILDRLAPPPTREMKFGTLVHKVILEGADFLKTFVVMPEFVGFTKDGRPSTRSGEANDKKQAWILEHADQTIVSQQELDAIRGIVDSIVEHEDAMAILKNGVTEVSGYYVDPETGIACRIRPDFLSADGSILADIKTTAKSSEEWDWGRTIWNFRYDVQLYMYGEGAFHINKRRPDYHVHIVAEKTPPYEVAVYPLGVATMELGRKGYHSALRSIADCMKANAWPRRQRRMSDIEVPHYILQQEGIFQ